MNDDALDFNDFKVRRYQESDRPTIRKICADTGFLGKPIEQVFEDRELFADYLTRYYLECEPESTFVLLKDGVVKGYMMGARFYDRQKAFNVRLGLGSIWGLLWRYFFVYKRSSRKFVRWLAFKGWREIPYTPKDMAHMHFNVLPESRCVYHTRSMADAFLKHLAALGEKKVYGQVVAFEKRRGPRMFARYGMDVVDVVEVTKYKEIVDHPVYLFTIVKDLEANTTIYGKDLWKEKREETRSKSGGATRAPDLLDASEARK